MSHRVQGSTHSIRTDVIAMGCLILITTGSVGYRLYYDNWLSGWDMLSQFLMWFPYLGSRLREFEIPGWNPSIASGTPFAAAPQSGWLYIPAMLWFTLFPAIIAMKVHVLSMCLLAGCATYALARRLGMGPLGALAGGASYAIGPLLYCATMNLITSAQVLMFIPLAVYATDAMITSRRHTVRLGWAMLGGIIVIQMLTGSPVRFFYGVIYMAIWLIYRVFFANQDVDQKRNIHLSRAILGGLVMCGSAGLFGLGVVVPQMRFNSQSSVAGANYDNVIGGSYTATSHSISSAIQIYLADIGDYRETAFVLSQVVLALLAIFLGRRRYGIPAFAIGAVVMIEPTLNHSLLRTVMSSLPVLGPIIEHNGAASKNFPFFGLSMLVAATVHMLASRDKALTRHSLAIVMPLVLVLMVALYAQHAYDVWFGWWQIWVAVIATGLLVLPGVLRTVIFPSDRLYRGAAIGLVALIVLFPTATDAWQVISDPVKQVQRAVGKSENVQNTIAQSVATHDPGTAAEYLQNQQASLQPFRYAPFTGTADLDANRRTALSRMFSPDIRGILAVSRATPLGLQQITQYAPTHLACYDDYLAVMNGTYQDYHYSEAMSAAVTGNNVLLDMLNVRYVLVPVRLDPQPPLASTWPVVYQDSYAYVYENPDVFPRAWIVHNVVGATGIADLEQINSGQVNARTTAFVTGSLPDVEPLSASDSPDKVTVTSDEPEKIVISATSATSGYLVVSEIYEDNWIAYVDGKRVNIQQTNHALRGVPLAAGSHTVVLKYEEPFIRYGTWTASFAGLATVCVWIWAGVGLIDDRRSQNRAFHRHV